MHSLQEDPPTGVSGAPTDNNIMIWNAVIFGPHDTPFEDGTFKLTIEFTEEYPNKPPTVRFVSKMFHPNVYADGGICLDILQNRWSPTYDVSAILTSIQVIICCHYIFHLKPCFDIVTACNTVSIILGAGPSRFRVPSFAFHANCHWGCGLQS